MDFFMGIFSGEHISGSTGQLKANAYKTMLSRTIDYFAWQWKTVFESTCNEKGQTEAVKGRAENSLSRFLPRPLFVDRIPGTNLAHTIADMLGLCFEVGCSKPDEACNFVHFLGTEIGRAHV